MMTPSTAGSNAVSAQVTVDVKAANLLSLSRGAVSFVYSPGGSLPNQVVSVTSSGGAAGFQAAASSSWVALSQTASYTPANLTISVLPQGLAPGTYHDKVNVFSDDVTNSPQTVDVTLTISTDPLFSALPFGLMFSHQIGVAPQANQLAVITNTMAGQKVHRKRRNRERGQLACGCGERYRSSGRGRGRRYPPAHLSGHIHREPGGNA
jgi:hypothetical protein